MNPFLRKINSFQIIYKSFFYFRIARKLLNCTIQILHNLEKEEKEFHLMKVQRKIYGGVGRHLWKYFFFHIWYNKV